MTPFFVQRRNEKNAPNHSVWKRRTPPEYGLAYYPVGSRAPGWFYSVKSRAPPKLTRPDPETAWPTCGKGDHWISGQSCGGARGQRDALAAHGRGMIQIPKAEDEVGGRIRGVRRVNAIHFFSKKCKWRCGVNVESRSPGRIRGRQARTQSRDKRVQPHEQKEPPYQTQ
jgi:hypothetical protein